MNVAFSSARMQARAGKKGLQGPQDWTLHPSQLVMGIAACTHGDTRARKLVDISAKDGWHWSGRAPSHLLGAGHLVAILRHLREQPLRQVGVEEPRQRALQAAALRARVIPARRMDSLLSDAPLERCTMAASASKSCMLGTSVTRAPVKQHPAHGHGDDQGLC